MRNVQRVEASSEYCRAVSISDLVASASDYCDPGVDISDVVIAQVTSDELEDAPGTDDGSTVNDIVIAPDCNSVQLRAERNGSLDGRFIPLRSTSPTRPAM